MPITGAALGRYGSQSLDMPAAWPDVLAGIPLFAGLDRRQLRKVAETARIVRVRDAAIIMKAGEPGDSLYVLVDGTVTVSRPGMPALVREQGSFFGEIALLDGGPRTATVVANGPVKALVITRSRFLKLLRDQPTIGVAMVKELARRLRASEGG
jgi:CRP-like cAMP-binding protein